MSRRLRALVRYTSVVKHALFGLAAAQMILACHHDTSSSGPTPPPAYAPPPARAVIEPGIVREVVSVAGVDPPMNPTLSASTPPELNVVRVVKYRIDAEPAKPARAIVVMMPGFLAGAGAFDTIARALVRRGAADPGQAIEVWAIDRRANFMEDTHGLDVAEFRKDASWSHRYYYDGETIEGHTFKGFIDPSDVPWESEWGMATTIGDLHAVIAQVPEGDRKSRVVLVGHSLGATIAEAYAAWDFGGKRGFDELAGLVLIDGVTGSEGDPASGFLQADYEHGSKSVGALSLPNLQTIRKSQPFITLPLLGVAVGELAERLAMATSFAPAEMFPRDDEAINALALMLGLTRSGIPKMTNRAAFGFAFDDDSAALSIAAVSCGSSTGGPLTKYKAIFGGDVLHPSDPTATYDWIDFDKTTPPESASMREVVRGYYEGPGLNFIEWYFPARLTLDAEYVGSLNIEESDWRSSVFGIRARHGAELDLPVLAFAAALTRDADGKGAKAYDKLQAMLAPTKIGAGRPLAGTARTDPRAYRLMVSGDFTHVDPVQAFDGGEGKSWYDALTDFVRTNTPPR